MNVDYGTGKALIFSFFPFSSSPLAQSILNAEFKKTTSNHPKKKGHLNV